MLKAEGPLTSPQASTRRPSASRNRLIIDRGGVVEIANAEFGVISYELGADVEAAIAIRGLSQEQTAQRAGISVQTYGCIERGMSATGRYSNPTLMTLLRIMGALDLVPPPFPQPPSAGSF